MKCNLPGPNVKVLGRSIHALARFGDELHLEILSDCIILRVLNAPESAFGMVKFTKNFFSYYNSNHFKKKNGEVLNCKISMKSALNTFKSPGHIDKLVESLEIKLDTESCKLIFQMKCKYGILKTHYVSLLEVETMNIAYSIENVHNKILARQKLLQEATNNFQSTDDEITLELTGQSLMLRNYTNNNTDVGKIIRTQICLRSAEFDNFTVDQETAVTFTLKEFRALLAFAEALNLPIQLNFNTTGQPIIFIVHNSSTFEANFVFSTSSGESNTQTTEIMSMRSKRKDTNLEGTIRKKQCLDVESTKPAEDIDTLCDGDLPEELFHIDNEKLEECDNIPPSPTSKNTVQCIFKRCFEQTFDSQFIRGRILAYNSDSE